MPKFAKVAKFAKMTQIAKIDKKGKFCKTAKFACEIPLKFEPNSQIYQKLPNLPANCKKCLTLPKLPNVPKWLKIP